MADKTFSWNKSSQFHLIEVVAYWEGRVTSKHLQRAFNIDSRTTSSQIFKEYLQHAKGNLEYSASDKGYILSDVFEPQYSQGDLGEYLFLMTRYSKLNPSFAGLKSESAATESVSLPHRAVLPDVVRQVVLATETHSRLEVVYHSHSSPEGEDRIIAPNMLVYCGLRWHVRAWCEKHRDFRDFVLTRIASGAEIVGEALPEASLENDKNWQHHIDLVVGPNPGLTKAQQSMVAMDYGMSQSHELRIPVRCALVHYLMLSLNIFLRNENFEPAAQPLVVVNRDEVAQYTFGPG